MGGSHAHGHGHGPVDQALAGSADGIRAIKVSFVGLGATAAVQAVIVALSGSVALLSDTLHNVADALTALPLWLAFSLSRRPPTRRFPYGLGRAEDLAGLLIVVVIAASAVLAAREGLQALGDARAPSHLAAVAAASVIGFLGNEGVARYRIRVGERIGSAALVADGHHARTDALTSLAVLGGVVGVWLGWPIADPIVGLLIAAVIVSVLWDASREVLRRLLDAVDPRLIDEATHVLRHVEGVREVGAVRIRWIGHRLHAEVEVEVDPALTIVDAHAIADAARHALLHDLPHLTSAIVHADPAGSGHHDAVAHHADPLRPGVRGGG